MSEDNGSVRYDAWMRRNPGHPGRHIRLGCMEDPDGKSMTVSEAAHKLGVSVVALSRVLNGRGRYFGCDGFEVWKRRAGLQRMFG